MKESYPIPNFDSFTVSVPQDHELANATKWLAEEFAPSRVEEFDRSLRTSLEASGDDVANDPENFKRGAEIFRLQDIVDRD